MNEQNLTDLERHSLLRLARETIEQSVRGQPFDYINLAALSEPLRQPGASFVTLTEHGELRGCIGALEAHQPLALDVQEHAAAAALHDPRFPPVRPAEVAGLLIEISVLSAPSLLVYDAPQDLALRLRPGVDGVILQAGRQRATFLPQVWEKLPAPEDFLDQLCWKMGARPGLWRQQKMTVSIYQVEEFHE